MAKNTNDTDTTDATDDGPGVPRAMVEAQHHHAKAAAQLAKGRTVTADHHLFRAFSALGDYLNEGDWKVEPAGDEDGADNRDPLHHLRRAIDAAAGEWTREEEILRGAHDDILAHREGQTDD